MMKKAKNSWRKLFWDEFPSLCLAGLCFVIYLFTGNVVAAVGGGGLLFMILREGFKK